MGKGIPQYLDLYKFQSLAFANQLPNRPSPVDLGFQLIVVFNSAIIDLTAVALMNQESRG